MRKILISLTSLLAMIGGVALAPLTQADPIFSIAAVTAVGPSGSTYNSFDLALTHDGARAYVANAGNRTVSVIDTTTNLIIGSLINVGAAPNAVAVSPDDEFVYVSNGYANTVSVIDTTTNTVVATVNVRHGSTGLAFNQDGSRVYVNTQDQNGNGAVEVIDTATNTLLSTSGLPITVGNTPTGAAFSPDFTHLYVTNTADGTVSVIDTNIAHSGTTYDTVTALITVGYRPQGLAVSPDGSQLLVANLDDSVSVIDTSTNVVSTTLSGFDDPKDVAFSPDGANAYVTNLMGKSVTRIKVAELSTADIGLDVGWYPLGIVVSSDGRSIYLTNDVPDGTVTVIAINEPASGPNVPTAPMQAYGRNSDGTCTNDAPLWVNWEGIASQQFSSWGLSWQQWPNNGTGGFVCQRQPYYTTAEKWSVR